MILEMMLAAALGPSGQAINCSSQAVDLKGECARELCGPPGTNPTIFVPAGSLDGYTPPADVQPEIERVANLMDESTQKFKVQADRYLDDIDNETTQDLPPERFNGVSTLFAPYVSWRVDGSKIKAVTQFPAGTAPDLMAGVTEWAKAREVSAQTDFPLRLRLGLASTEETVAALRVRLNSVLKALENPYLPSEFAKARENLLQNVSAFDRPAPPLEFLEQLDGYLGRFEDALNIATTPKSTTTAPAIAGKNAYDPACGKLCLKALKPFLTRAAIKKRIQDTRARMESERSAAVRACRAGMMLQAQNSQTETALEKSQQLVESALTSITSSPWLCPAMASGFAQFIRQNVDVTPEFPSKLLAGNEAMEAFTNMAQLRLTAVPAEAYNENLGALFDLSTVEGNVYGRDFRGCPSPRHLATDFFWQGIDKPLIHVSPHSCRHHDQGVATLAHELGHALAYFISQAGSSDDECTKAYLARRECVAKLQPLQPLKMPDGAQATFAFDRLTTEEDMADWVMQQAVPFKQHPLTCDFLKLNDAGIDYDPALFDVTPKPDDTHSGGLLRIIREYHAKTNTLPANCQQLMNAHSGIVEVRRCE